MNAGTGDTERERGMSDDDAGAGRDGDAEELDGRGGSLADVVGAEKAGTGTRRTTLTVTIVACLLGVALVASAPTIIQAVRGAAAAGPTSGAVVEGGSGEPTTSSGTASSDTGKKPKKIEEPSDEKSGTDPSAAPAGEGGAAAPTAGGDTDAGDASGADSSGSDGAATAEPGSGSGDSGGESGAGGGTQDGGGSGSGDAKKPASTTRTCQDCTYQSFRGAEVQLRPKWQVVGDTVQMAVDWRNADVSYEFDIVLRGTTGTVHQVRYTGGTETLTGSTGWFGVDAALTRGSRYDVAIEDPRPADGAFHAYWAPYPASTAFTY